jgi:hypothetical protein
LGGIGQSAGIVAESAAGIGDAVRFQPGLEFGGGTLLQHLAKVMASWNEVD